MVTIPKECWGNGSAISTGRLPKSLKEALADKLNARGKEEGIENFVDFIADETVGLTQEEILPWLKEKGHPALNMDPIM